MKLRHISSLACLCAALAVATAAPARACLIGCRPGDADARAVVEHLLAKRYGAPFKVLSYQTLRTADFDILVGQIRGYEIFYRARVEFPEGANLDCGPGAAQRPDDCSDDSYFSLIRDTRPKPGRQFVEPGGKRDFDEDLRFAEMSGGWKGPDGVIYKP